MMKWSVGSTTSISHEAVLPSHTAVMEVLPGVMPVTSQYPPELDMDTTPSSYTEYSTESR